MSSYKRTQSFRPQSDAERRESMQTLTIYLQNLWTVDVCSSDLFCSYNNNDYNEFICKPFNNNFPQMLTLSLYYEAIFAHIINVLTARSDLYSQPSLSPTHIDPTLSCLQHES